MDCRLLIREEEETRQIAFVQDGKLTEYFREDGQSVVGSIFLGRVERVLPDVKAAFVRIGLKLNAFLPLKEAESYHRTSGNSSLMSGQEILVQVKKAPKGGKGAFVTRDIALPGQYVLLMPCNRFIGMSKRIADEADRKRAAAIGETVAGGRFGVIVRHAALFASEEEILSEAERLWTLWQDIAKNAACAKAPLQMYQEPSMADVLQRDYSARHTLEISHDENDWNVFGVQKQIAQALGRRMELANGGSLMIDEREALHTVDVNSGRVVKAETAGKLPLEENLQAVEEIARQIRLRNLSGIILIDFIDMDTDADRARVLQAMEDAMKDDRVKNVVHGFTRLGLLEMTRKRTSDTLRDMLTVPCSRCHETGRIVSED